MMNLSLVEPKINPDDIPVTYDEIGRIYHINCNQYYSCSTLLGNVLDHSHLAVWKERVDDPDKILRQAGQLGTDYHSLGENFLLNRPLPKVQWLAEHFFDQTAPLLNANVTEVKGVELVLYSDIIKIAGRTDAIVYWKGKLSVLDFKCIGHHNPEWLEGYWSQLSIYAHMYGFLYGVKPKNLVLVVANKKNMKVKVFESSTILHDERTVELIKDFHSFLRTKNARNVV
jgi:hypothetical protein